MWITVHVRNEPSPAPQKEPAKLSSMKLFIHIQASSLIILRQKPSWALAPCQWLSHSASAHGQPPTPHRPGEALSLAVRWLVLFFFFQTRFTASF